MASLKQGKDLRIYQIQVTLGEIRPPIWRRIQVTSDTTLRKLHRILQEVMGWEDYHLHQFIIDELDYGEPDLEIDYGNPTKSDRTVRLSEVVSRPKTKFAYEYDFGDGWWHEILIEKILPPQEKVRYPVCLAGKRACPPEDCGGPPGYAEFLEAIRDSNHERHEELLEWIGGSFDPDAFDLNQINTQLRRIR